MGRHTELRKAGLAGLRSEAILGMHNISHCLADKTTRVRAHRLDLVILHLGIIVVLAFLRAVQSLVSVR